MSMRRGSLFLIFGLLSLVVLLTACGASQPEDSIQPQVPEAEKVEDPHDDGSLSHDDVVVPSEYAGLINPLADSEEAVAAGAQLYANSCAGCHGETGAGDGPAAASLNPSPVPFTDSHEMAEMGDDYLFWRISRGGTMAPFNSSMPAWDSSLDSDQIWQLVSYLRTLSE